MQFSAQVWIGEVVAQEHRSEKPSKLIGTATTTVTRGGAPHRRSPTLALMRPVRMEAAKRSIASQPVRSAVSATLVLTTGSIACAKSRPARQPEGTYSLRSARARKQSR